MFHEMGKEKWTGVVIVMSDKTCFNTKAMKRDEEEHYITIRGLLQQE